MATYDINNIAELLSGNTYPGRGIIIGKSSDGASAMFAYFIMGRSENSRNRIFKREGSDITIYPYDASKVSDPSLIIYSPVRSFGNSIIVTNGDQTDTVYDHLEKGSSFEAALETREFEPDAPNFTPRISGIINFTDNGFTYKMNILKSADADGSACNRFNYSYSPIDGLGHFIHTYAHDGNPIPTFEGEPERVAIPSDLDRFTDMIWDNLNEQNKISLYVCSVSLSDGHCESRLVNKNSDN